MSNVIDRDSLPDNTAQPVDGPKDAADFIAGVAVETDSTETESAEPSN